MWKNIAEAGRPQMTIWRMPIACGETKFTKTGSEYTLWRHTASPLQHWLHERPSLLRYTYTACLGLYTYKRIYSAQRSQHSY